MLQLQTNKIINKNSPISIVVAARNCRSFIKDTLASALNQSHKPLEIIYVDDGSDDDTLELATNNFPQVKIISQLHSGVAAARNKGIEESKGEWIVFLDGDDIFPYNYLEEKYKAIKEHPDCCYVYSAAQAFGCSTNYYWEAPNWTEDLLWGGNFINTSTLFRKSCLETVGMWSPSIGTAWDYDLVFRLTQAGFRGVPEKEGFLLYRHHEQSTSHLTGQKQSEEGQFLMKFLIRIKFAKIFIGCILSDRLNIFDKWLKSITENIKYYVNQLQGLPVFDKFGTISAPLPYLNIICTGSDFVKTSNLINRYKEFFQGIRIQYSPFIAKYEEAEKIATMLSNNYNTMLEMESDIAWFVEDDIIPSKNTFYDLVFNLLGGKTITPLYAVTGVYRNRREPKYYMLHNWHGEMKNLQELPSNNLVDIAGTGCLMIFRPYAPHKFAPMFNETPAHDWYWCMQLKKDKIHYHPKDKKICVIKDAVCKHYINEENYV